jgi:porphobilinogen synthase
VVEHRVTEFAATDEAITTVKPSDLVMVLLVRDDADAGARPMPTLGLQDIGAAVKELTGHGVSAVKVFASGDRRDATGSAALSGDSMMSRAIQEVKAADASMTVMTETCLCSYTDTGECHVTGRAGKPDVAATVDAIAEQAVVQARAGADIVGPAAMLAGSVRRVRQELDSGGWPDIRIMPHLIFDSRLYDGYRRTMDAVPACERRAFQVDPGQPARAVRVSLDFVDEGADMLLLEPALFCVDVLIECKRLCSVPLAPFSVSGEYTSLMRAGGDHRLLLELFTMLKRAGSDQIITYAAAEIARKLAG